MWIPSSNAPIWNFKDIARLWWSLLFRTCMASIATKHAYLRSTGSFWYISCSTAACSWAEQTDSAQRIKRGCTINWSRQLIHLLSRSWLIVKDCMQKAVLALKLSVQSRYTLQEYSDPPSWGSKALPWRLKILLTKGIIDQFLHEPLKTCMKMAPGAVYLLKS